MYTKKSYSIKDMVWWTRHETVLFAVIAFVPVVVYEVAGQRWLHLPWLPIALVGTAVAFIIGFQNSATYDRLWEARKIWGGIVNTSRTWGLLVNDFITNDFTDRPADESELRQIRKQLIHRHIAWLTALRYFLRQPRPWELFKRNRSNREWSDMMGVHEHHNSMDDELASVLSREDLDYVLSKTSKATHVLSLQSKQLRELRTRGLIEDFRHMEMEKALAELIGLQGRSERIKNFPYPRQYATLNAYFLWIFLLLLPFGVMFEFSDIGAQLATDYPAIGELFVWFSIPFSVVVMWVFHTMERIGRVSENPFEGNPNDIPITTMSRAIEIDLREILDQDEARIPEPIAPTMHAQT